MSFIRVHEKNIFDKGLGFSYNSIIIKCDICGLEMISMDKSMKQTQTNCQDKHYCFHHSRYNY